MNIESARYRVRSCVGGYWLTDKRFGNVEFVTEMPSAHALAMMHESAFDLICANKMRDGESRP